MDNREVIILLKKNLNGYEKIIVQNDGYVIYELNKNGSIEKETKKITILNELIKKMDYLFDKCCSVYDNKKDLKYEVTYNNHIFYSFELYIDLSLMIKHDKLHTFSVIKEFKENKKELLKNEKIKQELENLNYFDKLKKTINISNVKLNEPFESKKNIIKFDLIKKSNFEIGESRFFTNSIDIPENFEIPNGFSFIGQINLKDVCNFDSYNILPKKGILYFFQAPPIVSYNDKDYFFEMGKVIYTEDTNLIRKKITTPDELIMNLAMTNVVDSVEDFNLRYKNENGTLNYDGFYSDDLNKIYGFYTDCQILDDEIKKISQEYIVLLQLGSKIYGEGVTTFLISKEDLLNKNFNNIIYKYVQS